MPEQNETPEEWADHHSLRILLAFQSILQSMDPDFGKIGERLPRLCDAILDRLAAAVRARDAEQRADELEAMAVQIAADTAELRERARRAKSDSLILIADGRAEVEASLRARAAQLRTSAAHPGREPLTPTDPIA